MNHGLTVRLYSSEDWPLHKKHNHFQWKQGKEKNMRKITTTQIIQGLLTIEKVKQDNIQPILTFSLLIKVQQLTYTNY